MAEENGYTLRELKGDDAFLMIRILSKIGIDRLKKCMDAAAVKTAIAVMANTQADEAAKEEAMNSVGMAVMMEIACAVLDGLPQCRDEIYKLLAQLSGKTVNDIADMGLVPLVKMIKEVFRKEEFKDFFTEVSGLLN